MNILKKYKFFEAKHPNDHNYESEIEAVLEKLVEQKIYISMLKDSIYNVSEIIEEILPNDIEQYISALYHYEKSMAEKVEMIRQNLIEGYPNLKDLVEELENDISDIEEYLEDKKAKDKESDINI